MGCISSKTDISEIRPNLFKVDVVPRTATSVCSGELEITPEELVLYRRNAEPTKWSLKHLRRYGFESDLFTFEAGRRCTTGEGIYAFRCSQAAQLFHILQSYIEDIPLNEGSMSLATSTTFVEDHLSTSINTLRQRQNFGSSRNCTIGNCSSMAASEPNYLEPDGHDVESTDSVHSLSMFAGVPTSQQAIPNHNLYQDYPANKDSEYNNNNFTKSTDRPPDNEAPSLCSPRSPNHECRMYENITSADLEQLMLTKSVTGTPKMVNGGAGTFFEEASSRCYVNVDLNEMRPILKNRNSKSEIFTKMDFAPALSLDKSAPNTPVTTKPDTGMVNYIVLDLGDQSPSSQVTTAPTFTQSASKAVLASGCKRSGSNHMLTKSLSTGSGISTTNSIHSTKSKIESGCLKSPDSPKTEPFGYATIDFNKTVALSNSTAPSLKTEMKGIRRTRHSSCVGQSNSISD